MSDDKKLGLGELVQKAIYLGVGVANFAAQRAGTALQELRQQAQKLADEMVKRGEMNVDEARRFVDEIIKNAQQPSSYTDDSSESTKHKEPRQIEIVTDDEDKEVEALKKRVQSLQEELRNLNKQ